jgi:fructosamine-3-kinase
MAIPNALRQRLAEVIGAPVEQDQAVYGGDINQSARFVCGGMPYFVKWNASAPPTMFPTEADGLRRLGAAGAVRVPAVIAQGDADGGCPAFLVLEWIDTGGKRGDTMEQFGAALAELHRHTAATYAITLSGGCHSPIHRPQTGARFTATSASGHRWRWRAS